MIEVFSFISDEPVTKENLFSRTASETTVLGTICDTCGEIISAEDGFWITDSQVICCGECLKDTVGDGKAVFVAPDSPVVDMLDEAAIDRFLAEQVLKNGSVQRFVTE